MSKPEDITVQVRDPAAARALRVFALVIEDPELRSAFKESPEEAFDAARKAHRDTTLREAGYTDIPERSRAVLEQLGIEELDLLAKLGDAFFADGLYIEVPPYGKAWFK